MFKDKKKVEFGDFQTPITLAKKVVDVVSNDLTNVQTIIEPTCGIGTFLKVFIENNYSVKNLIGWEINPAYIEMAKENLSYSSNNNTVIKEQDFFEIDWGNVEKTVVLQSVIG